VGDRAVAEDILQDALVKLVSRPEQAPSDEGIVPWFYRTLRNAAIELEMHATPTDEMAGEICGCV
jgi:RNA polymerase sigma-70 factor (ECF subfamily)